MCGPAGSGKTTHARGLEARGFVRLSFDLSAWERGIRRMPLETDEHRAIEAELRDRLAALVGEDRDVVLDLSFWSRAMRDDWRAFLAPLGVVPETIYLATDRATCLARVATRAHAHADDVVLDPAVAEAYVDHFEPPTADEGPLVVVSP